MVEFTRARPRYPASISTKPESRYRLASVATRLLLLIAREPMQKPLAHGPVGDDETPTQPGRSKLLGTRTDGQNEAIWHESGCFA
jgi:hypothetical protein